MSNGGWGRLAISIAGAFVGNMILPGFGTSLGFFGGAILGSMIFPQKTKSTPPQLGDYPVQTAEKGTPIPFICGSKEVAGNIIYAEPAEPYSIAHSSGGGGKSGGGEAKTYETRYRRTFLICVCEGPAWVMSARKGKLNMPLSDFTWYDGQNNSGLSALLGIDYAEYKTCALALFENYDTGSSEQIPNMLFEVSSEYVGIESHCVIGDDLYIIHGKGVLVNAGVITNEGGLTGIPCSYHPFEVGHVIRVGGTSTLDSGNGYAIVEITDDRIIVNKGYQAETLDGDERIFRFLQNYLEDYGYGHGCIIGDYYYVPINYLADYQTCIIRIKRSTLAIESDWADDPVTYGWYGGQVGMNCKASPDGLYVFLQTLNFEILYKYRVSDGALIWEFYHPDGQNDSYILDVDSDGCCYLAEIKDAGEYGRGKVAKIAADGSAATFFTLGLTPKAYYHGGNYCSALNESADILATGGHQSGNSEILGSRLPLRLWNLTTLTDIAYFEIASDYDFFQLLWHDGYLYAYGDTTTYNGDTVNIWKFDTDLNVIATGYVSSVGCFWVGNDRHIWVGRTSPSLPNGLVILDKDDLSVRESLKIHYLCYVTNPIITSAEYVTNYRIAGETHDEYPPNIIKAIAIRLDKEDLINETKFNAALDYCIDQDIKLSFAFKDLKPWTDWINYINSHYAGYYFWQAGQLCLGVYKDENSVASITQDDLIREEGEPPVQINPFSPDWFNRTEIKWTNRDDNYGTAIAVAKDDIDIRNNGLRKHAVDLAGIHNATLAQKMVERMRIDSQCRRRLFSFALSYKYLGLERGDVIDITDGYLLTAQKMRIINLVVSPHGRKIVIKAVEDGSELYPTITWSTETTEHILPTIPTVSGSRITYREDTDEAKLNLSIAPITQYANGWDIYKSNDGGSSYNLIGRCAVDGITGGDANSIGTLTKALLATASTTWHQDESFEVDIGTVTDLSTSITDAQLFNGLKLAKIDDEIIGYKDCEETGVAGIWKIKNLIRGLFNTEPVAHSVSANFATLDVNYTYIIKSEDIGHTLYFKAVTFYGDYYNTLAATTAYSHAIQGHYNRPAPISLLHMENREGFTDYDAASVVLQWEYGDKNGGFNDGVFNGDGSSWNYGDDENDLLEDVGGITFGSPGLDANIKELKIIIEETDGTHINTKTYEPGETVFDDKEITLTYAVAGDLNSKDPAVVKFIPVYDLQDTFEKSITLDKVGV